MQLDEKWSISSDRYNWILTEKYETVSKKTGKAAVGERVSYFGQIGHLAKRMIDEEIKGCLTMAEISARIEEISNQVQELCLEAAKNGNRKH